MDKFEAYKVFTGNHWTIYIDHLQPRLGQVYIWANRSDAVDLTEANPPELLELHDLLLKVRKALVVLFNPDLFNYASLGNTVKHLHVHVIPRYRENRTFEGVTLTDNTFGKHYEVDPVRTELPVDWIEKVRKAIGEQMNQL